MRHHVNRVSVLNDELRKNDLSLVCLNPTKGIATVNDPGQ